MPKKVRKTNNAIVPFTPSESRAIQKVFDSVPKEELQAALIDSGDPRALQLAERMSDHEYSRTAIAHQCYQLKLNPKDVWNILIDSRRTEARLKVSEALTGIVQQVTDQAVDRIAECPRCEDGVIHRKDAEDEACTWCAGSGRVVVPADKESQKMALEIGELLNQKVPLIAQQFNSYKNGQGGAGADMPDMADWSRNTDSIFEERD